VQTNEVQRCWGLLPAFLVVAREVERPLSLIELGPSAGLNLLWDRYRYRYGGESWGPTTARLLLDGELRATLPHRLLATKPRVRSRIGVDRSPVDVTSEEGALLLQCFVWADQPRRLERLQRAIEVLQADPPELVQGDYVELLPELLAARDPDAFTVVYQTASFGYLQPAQRARIDETLERAGKQSPLAFISASMPDDEALLAWSLRLRLWPGGQERTLAHMDYHGEWLQWLAR
jgi:hypothetical protein